MTIQEKVIKGLECCKKANDYDCAKCKYVGEDNCYSHLCDDAIALIEEKGPRLMTLEEVERYVKEGRPFYMEYINGTFGWTVPSQDFQSGFNYGNAKTPELRQFYAHYNNAEDAPYAFRCWTDAPTDKQRQEAKWDGCYRQGD